MIFKKKHQKLDYPEVLYQFKLSESLAHNEFKTKHKRWCLCTGYTYHIYDDLIDIECPVCHQRINLNRSY